MSTKIYDAYRIPRTKLNEFLMRTRHLTFTKVLDTVDMFLGHVDENLVDAKVKEDIDGLTKGGAELPEWYNKERAAQRHRWEVLKKAFKKASISSLRSGLCIDASLNVWIRGRYAYIIPYGYSVCPTDLEWVEDYCYFNNTDRPERVTARQWAARSNMWDKLCLNDHDATRLSYTIVEFSGDHRSVFVIEAYVLDYESKAAYMAQIEKGGYGSL
jgi:hypothetical protein